MACSATNVFYRYESLKYIFNAIYCHFRLLVQFLQNTVLFACEKNVYSYSNSF